MSKTFSWFSIFRLGLVQMALGSIIVLTTSTLNRLMIVEGALPAVIPGLLVSFHYGIQITRPAWGFFSDTGKTRTKWILVGMSTLSAGGILATLGTLLIQSNFLLGIITSIVAYGLIGLGVGAAGTSLLAYLAIATKPERRAAAASLTWLMMIFGIAVTAGIVGNLIEPYSNFRVLKVISSVCVLALLVTILAVYGIEKKYPCQPTNENSELPLSEGLREVWSDPKARLFTLFVGISMTAYFMQELILEPYAGLVFNLTPGQTTSLSGIQNGGVFVGMLTVGITVSGFRIGSLKTWVCLGCVGSSFALITISIFAFNDFGLSISIPVAILGFCNGTFAVGAIGSMMQLAGQGVLNREGTRMGLWGASQAIAAGFGGLLGTVLVDLLRLYFSNPANAFGIVFSFEAFLFIVAAVMGLKMIDSNKYASINQPLGV